MNILIADDHKSIVSFFIMVFNFTLDKNEEHHYEDCNNCAETKTAIDKFNSQQRQFDLAIIDFSMPPDIQNDLLDGGAVCDYLKQEMPNCKVIINTYLFQKLIIFDIMQASNPEGFVIKSDMDMNDYILAINLILSGQTYKSIEAENICNEIIQNKIFIKKINRMIVHLLAQGFKTDQIAEKLQISSIAVLKRMAIIKEEMGVDKNNTILFVAKQKGYV
jgi:DNA-binding NarL/FixJ family response regulator